jgi:hypothetical protein
VREAYALIDTTHGCLAWLQPAAAASVLCGDFSAEIPAFDT